MKKAIPIEFVYQVFSLLIAIIVVHAVYVAVIRPNADAFIEREHQRMKADPEYVQKRSIFVVIRDFEQEACFVLALWAFSIMGFKGYASYRERKLLDTLVDGDEETPGVELDTQKLSRRLGALPGSARERLLPRALGAALHRFSATGNVQDVSAAAREVCQTEADRLESELSIIRYIAWAIPSIGFIGTVRGISDALAQAHRAVEGDITGVTQSLGVAFNSTFVALAISIVVMFFVHQLQLAQERVVLETETYCDRYLIHRLRRSRP
jgi:biopolymer transport protein ExbB/TolQ